MVKGLNIDNYYDGYKTSDINCVDLPIAASAGHFNRDYYFFYCLCYSYILNWGNYTDDNWFEIRKIILNLLGLDFYRIKVNKKKELYNKVIQCIKDEFPVIFIVKYGSLFYSKYYKWGTYDHGLIVSDFNDEYKIFGVRDREVVREHITSGIFSSDVMHKIQIDYKQLYKIWKKSNELFLNEKSIHHNTFYCIKPIDKNRKIDIKKLVLNVLDESKNSAINQFERYIFEFQEKLINNVQLTKMEEENARRRFHRSFYTFNDVIKKYYITKEFNDIDSLKVNAKLEIFLKSRLDIINKLHLYSLRKMQIPDNDIQKFVNQDFEYFTCFKNELVKLLN